MAMVVKKLGKRKEEKFITRFIHACGSLTLIMHVQGSCMPPESYDHSVYTTALNTTMILPNIETSRDRKVNV